MSYSDFKTPNWRLHRQQWAKLSGKWGMGAEENEETDWKDLRHMQRWQKENSLVLEESGL